MQTVLLIALTPTDPEYYDVIVNFVRQLTNRLSSNYCTDSLNSSTTRDILNDYFLLFNYNIFANDDTVYHIRMPWIDRQSIDAYAQMVVDNIVFLMLIDNPDSAPHHPSNDTADRLPIYEVCNDDFIANLRHTLRYNYAKKKRLLFLSNVVYNCLTTAVLENVPLSYYLFNHRDTVIEYVYFNDRKHEQNFTNEQFHQSLSAAFPSSTNSSNHFYYVQSINDINKAFDQISFCSDQLASLQIIESKKIQLNQVNNNDLSIVTIRIIIAAVVVILLFIVFTAFVIRLRNRIKAKEKRINFIRQVNINDRHGFNYIQTLWKVPESNVDIDNNCVIGKGVQSTVYKGECILYYNS
jgi:hypothetical protein